MDFLSKITDFSPAMPAFQKLGVENDLSQLDLPCIIAYLQSYASEKIYVKMSWHSLISVLFPRLFFTLFASVSRKKIEFLAGDATGRHINARQIKCR